MLVESEPLVRIFSDIEEEHRSLTTLIAMLSVDQLTARPTGAWSALDTVIHVTAWQANALAVARLQAEPDAPDVDPAAGAGRILGLDANAYNEQLLAEKADWTLDHVLNWNATVFAELKKALATLPPSRLLGGPGPHGARLWFGRPTLAHSREHRLDLAKRVGLA